MLTNIHPKIGSAEGTERGFSSTMGVFQNLPEPTRKVMERYALVRKVEKDEVLFREEDPVAWTWFVEKGFVKEVILTKSGQSLVLHLTGPNDLLAAGSLAEPRYGCRGVAATDALVWALPINFFWGLLEQYPRMAARVAHQVSIRLNQANEKLVSSKEDAESRVLRVLRDLSEKFGGTIPLTRREISEMSGTCTETTIRILSRLQRQGVILKARGQVQFRLLVKRPVKIG